MFEKTPDISNTKHIGFEFAIQFAIHVSIVSVLSRAQSKIKSEILLMKTKKIDSIKDERRPSLNSIFNLLSRMKV